MDSIKDHYLYPMYMAYIQEKRITKGAFELFKISQEYFFNFKSKYDNDEGFKYKQDIKYKSVLRDSRIDDILL